jgi:hypothetical protein
LNSFIVKRNGFAGIATIIIVALIKRNATYENPRLPDPPL